MEIEFFNRGLLNIIEPHGINPEDVARVQFGECTIIITLKNGERYTIQYMIQPETWYNIQQYMQRYNSLIDSEN